VAHRAERREEGDSDFLAPEVDEARTKETSEVAAEAEGPLDARSAARPFERLPSPSWGAEPPIGSGRTRPHLAAVVGIVTYLWIVWDPIDLEPAGSAHLVSRWLALCVEHPLRTAAACALVASALRRHPRDLPPSSGPGGNL
jgi:hypothetical protein